jgi:CRP-like cAMP-binding protein
MHQMTPTGENRILQSLSLNDLSLLRPQLKLIDLKRGTVLHEAGAPLEYVYFPTGGMVSILAIMRTGDAIETAVIGREGVVGRWLLHASDATESNMVNLTQEFLSHMLGVQRTSVTLTAHALQKSGLIRYSRGKVEILDRHGVEECACECYAALRRVFDNARGDGRNG